MPLKDEEEDDRTPVFGIVVALALTVLMALAAAHTITSVDKLANTVRVLGGELGR